MAIRAKKEPNPIDIYVGNKIRLTRKNRGLKQTTLAEAINVSFQQLQKYENGTNRISASRLHALSNFFNVEPAYFFEGMEQQDEPVLSFDELLKTPESMELIKYFKAAANDNVRQKIFNIIKIAAQ